jgi:hypothetical protein
VHPGFLDVLHHRTDDDLAGAVAQRVDVDLDRVLQEPVDERGPLRGEATLPTEAPRSRELGHREVERGVVVDDLHRPAAEHVRRAHEDRVADVAGDGTRAGGVGRGPAGRVRDAEAAAEAEEARAVLGEVDRSRARAEHAQPSRLERVRQLQRRLPPERDDDPLDTACGASEGIADVADVLDREGLEEETIAGVVVGRHGLGIAVDHHRLVARGRERERGVHAAVVELHALADPVGPAAEDDDGGSLERRDLVLVLVGAVVVRRPGSELRGTGVDRLRARAHTVLEPCGAYRVGSDAPEVRELAVAEAEPLDRPPVAPRQLGHRCRRDRGARLADDRDLVEEPGVDAGDLVEPFDADAAAQRGLEEEHALGCRGGRGPHQLVGGHRVELRLRRIRVEAEAPGLEAAERLLQRLREGATDRHDLAHGLHLRAEQRSRAGQLLERPARHLRDDVVDRGLEARGSLTGDVVAHLVEAIADREARRDLRDREAGRLAGQRARARDAGVHLDDDHLPRRRVDGELDVRSPGVDTDAADARERGVAHPLVLDVGERLCRRDGDRVARVHAHRVEVLDRADDDHVVGPVAHHLELVLLPPEHRPLDEDLADRARREPARRDVVQLRLVPREARAAAAEDERRAHDDREADDTADGDRLVDAVREPRARHREPDLLHRGLEPRAVLRRVDRVHVGADELDAVSLQHPGVVQRDREVEGGLAAERREQRVRALALDDAGDALEVERLDVRGVRELGVGHDRRRVRVHEQDPVSLVAQHAAGLRPRVVELARLSDDDRAAPDHEDRLEVVAARHGQRRPSTVPAMSAVNSANR